MKINLNMAANNVQKFIGDSLTEKLSRLEHKFRKSNNITASEFCKENMISTDLILSSLKLKQLAGQINVIIHAVGILTIIPSILEEGEYIENLSLGAGNTGRKYDFESNFRIAEFKFINWKGGAEAIRQNSLFKDFYELAESNTNKRRILYLIGLDIPLKFLNGKRSLDSVMSKNNKLLNDFKAQYGNKFSVVREYYNFRKSRVELIDLVKICPTFREITEDVDVE